ncbi:VapC toxin family PIN domain ribonuclease [Novosphingobium sp. Gsoil 351]|uniref:VapC toxin family PIN domain ribonuclease n=1 Tax=Novosphingobium sp. Gsoil 351 TaxID=2675225 RepID=UPI0012B4B3E3|nr:VapC toxin family PIN domain ribonuclease [Novosphingobium sp. Gsoil 351]QGN55062.1 VapC toxin family PIN domain ribonuclease [Novosphingobium sp. Gsoil 351]
MILVDSSVWVAHLRTEDRRLTQLIVEDRVVHHAFVTGEIGMGSFSSPAARSQVVEFLRGLEPAVIVGETEFHDFVSAKQLYGTGAGFVDCHLLASIACSPEVSLWTTDSRLAIQARRIGVELYG